MEFDVVLSGGLFFDGSGAPGRVADVGIADGRVAAVGGLDAAEARERVDCTGLAVSPGFIDIHTHYDAQVFWDPALTPTSWHGVTTVLTGNCGFGVAPMRAGDNEVIVRTLEKVEGMSAEALRAGVDWGFESFGQYLDHVAAAAPVLNVASFVPHTPLRMAVMGPEAFDRVATDDEVAAMGRVLRTAIDEGAFGFSTSKAPSHVVAGGRPIPSRQADNEEIYTLARAITGVGHAVQMIGGPGFGIPEFRRVAQEFGGAVTWTSLRTSAFSDRHWTQAQQTEDVQAEGIGLWAQMGCTPVSTLITFGSPDNVFESLPAFGQLSGYTKADRTTVYNDPAWRQAAYEQMSSNAHGLPLVFDWKRIFVDETDANPAYIGKSIAQLATELGATNPIDVMADLSIADDLETRFRFMIFDYDDEIVGELLQRRSILLGLGDGGAHASQLCDASYCTHLLGHWVRELGVLPLEFAIWRLTGHPAEVLGFNQRGLLKTGYHADICVFNPHTITQGPLQRVYDLPAGIDRLIRQPTGIEHVLVNGTFIRRNNTPTNAHPGTLIGR